MKSREQEVLNIEQPLFGRVPKLLICNELVEEPTRVRRFIVPQMLPRRSLKPSQDPWVNDAMPTLENCGPPHGPANYTFGAVNDPVHFCLCKFVYWPRQVGKVQRLDRLDAEGHLVHDAAKAVV